MTFLKMSSKTKLEHAILIPQSRARAGATFLAPVPGVLAFWLMYVMFSSLTLAFWTGLSVVIIAWCLVGYHQFQDQADSKLVRIEFKNKNTIQYADLPKRRLSPFAQDILASYSTFSERGAIQSGYGKANFIVLRDAFLARGWASWNDPANRNQGLNLTDNGSQVLGGIARTHE